MKKLFLASFAAVTIELVETLLPKLSSECKAAFIPTAGDMYEDADRFQQIMTYLALSVFPAITFGKYPFTTCSY